MSEHAFHAVAFVENFNLKEMAALYPGAKVSPHDVRVAFENGGEMFFYPFGAVVFCDLDVGRRAEELARLHRIKPGLTQEVVSETFMVRESPGAKSEVGDGILVIDALTSARSAVVALTVGQSAGMEYYERIVDRLFARTDALVQRLERTGSVPINVRNLHRFIGEAVGVRNETIAILHLLDKPDAVWDDPVMEEIYVDLRAEFDLLDRYAALESKVRTVQEALELVLDVARDRRMWVLEATIVLLIVVEIVLSLAKVV